MQKHIFLTGEKGVGKSTIIRKLLDGYKGTIAGFFTVRTNEVYHDRYSVHLLAAGGMDKPSEENLLFFCGVPFDEGKTNRFNNLGCKALEGCMGAELIVMDELGPNEGNATEFCQAVMNVLNGDVPVIGVLQKADSPFLKVIANHPKVQVIEVTNKNRDGVLETLRSIIE
jgi:nucleoside-triphosphatase THEP1